MEGLQVNFTLIVQALIFIGAIFIVTYWILTPIIQIIQERQARVTGFKADTTDLNNDFEKFKRDYEEKLKEARQKAKDIREELRRTGVNSRENILEEARQETQEFLNKIRIDIGAQIEDARSSMIKEAERLSKEIVKRIIGRDAA